MGRRGDHTQDEIREMALKAAEQMVCESGYASVSTRKVAKAIGYTVGSLYMVFRNLDEIFFMLNARTVKSLYLELHRQSTAHTDPKAQLFALADGYARYALEQSHRWTLLFDHRLPEGMEVPTEYRTAISEMFKLIEEPLSQLVPQCPPEDLTEESRILWSGVHGICHLALTGTLDFVGIHSVRSLSYSFIERYLAGLANEA